MAPDMPDPLEPDRTPDVEGITPEVFRASFGEDLHRLLDLDTWRTARDLSSGGPG